MLEQWQRITKDEWILVSGGKIAGRLKCRYTLFHNLFWPREYEITAHGRVVGLFRQQHKNVLDFKYTMEIWDRCIDTRLLVAAGIVIATVLDTF